MDVLLMIVYATIALGFLVFIHEGGHYLASRLFGVRVTEFMLGLPGPSVGFQYGETRFGVTAVLLGGYARVCGMEPGEMSPHLAKAMESVYRRGTATMEEVAQDCGITDDEAYEALEELDEWGTVKRPLKSDEHNTYRTPAVRPTRGQIRRAQRSGQPVPQAAEMGAARPLDDPEAFFESEYRQQYRSLPFWKRSVILVAGVAVNILFALMVFVLVYSVIGIDLQNTQTGEVVHRTIGPLQAIQAGFSYIGMVAVAVAQLFNPQTAAETVSNSSSIVGIAVISKTAAEAGFASFLSFMGMLSVSLGVMNLIPIPPLDGGRFVIEVYQKLSKRLVSEKAMGRMSMVGMGLFYLFFIVMVGKDVQRILFGG
ncbi:peptidase M50 [Eggerthellaceae bacterium zg-1084]|uniref:site-2 protease family protein n=1 Tax=Berryella wangjianweii TaxID=2734634 RepID=UPI001557C503|nr:site-2 protease family protein [Berryella wangjianweii]NPD30515.1 peptidase M50 [Berryella wangjianweii]